MEYSIIVPVYNEEKVINEAFKRIKSVMDTVSAEYEMIFIDDGSKDTTKSILKNLTKENKKAKAIFLSRNFGHQAAISAGLDYCSGQAVVIIDADMQDPPEIIPEMIKKWKEGYDVVYGKRISRKGENSLKKITAKLFYILLNMLTKENIPEDVGDFKLIDRKVANALKKIHEKNRYLRGIISWLGFKQGEMEYERKERYAGETKYTTSKMIKLSMDAITSFSYAPLKIATYIGFFISGISFLYLIVVIYQKVFTNTTIKGWASITAVNLFFNGIVLVILGIFGEYIGRIYDEANNRPIYIVDDTSGIAEKNQ